MRDPKRLPGARDVRVSLDDTGSDRVVVASPPHPQMGGDRRDSRLRAVSDSLTTAGIDCLRFDYGPWDDGVGERSDALTALEWAGERYERVGLFGYSFGGGIALCATAAATESPPEAVAALAPVAVPGELDAVAALDAITVPVRIVYGRRDESAQWRPVVERARELGATVESLPADHFFVSQRAQAAESVSEFFRSQLP